jgi:hypothetical protein
MRIQHFTMRHRRVPDPMRPGRTASVGYLVPSGTSAISGLDVTPDADGWLDVPHEVAQELCSFRDHGSGFYTEGEIDEEVRLHRVEIPTPERPKRRTAAREDESAPRRS